MIDSIALYAGAAAAFGGAIAMLRKRSRRAGAIVAASGVAVAAAALFWPVPELKTATGSTLLDQHFTKWQFDEEHAIDIDASPERVSDAIRRVTPREIRLFRTLTAIRRLGRDAPEGTLNAPKNDSVQSISRACWRNVARVVFLPNTRHCPKSSSSRRPIGATGTPNFTTHSS